jgi:hypothetical protein
MTKKSKIISITTLIVIVALTVFFYVRYFFVFGEGVKAGELNYIVHKGYVFKTYEGLLIQSGFRKSTTAGAVQSYEFPFSVKNQAIADTLMLNSGKEVKLRYKEYFAPLPWRGMQKYIVYKIESISE